MELAWDRIVCNLTAHRTVTSDTVRVFVQATLTQGGEEKPELRETILAALGSVCDGPWRVSSVSRAEDDSGMERVRLIATIRVPERQTSGLVERLRKASRSGLKLELNRAEYRPPRKQVEEALRELRQEIYREAQAEADRLNEAMPSDTTPWRVGGAQMTEETGWPSAADRNAVAMMMNRGRSPGSYPTAAKGETEEANMDPGMPVETRAKVTFGRLALPLEVFAKLQQHQGSGLPR
jgi:hypothetical protein